MADFININFKIKWRGILSGYIPIFGCWSANSSFAKLELEDVFPGGGCLRSSPVIMSRKAGGYSGLD